MTARAPERSKREHLRVSPEVAAIVRRIRALPPGIHSVVVQVDGSGGLSWMVAEFGKEERCGKRD